MEATSVLVVDRIYGDESLTSPRLVDANSLFLLLGQKSGSLKPLVLVDVSNFPYCYRHALLA